MEKLTFDVIVVGMGVSALATAYFLLKNDCSLRICLVGLPDSQSKKAQGGIVVPEDQEWVSDTLKASFFTADIDLLKEVIGFTPVLKETFEEIGFTATEKRREGGHRRRRIWAYKDYTGLKITSLLFNYVRRFENVRFFVSRVEGVDLENRAVLTPSFVLVADKLVLAFGGYASSFASTTNDFYPALLHTALKGVVFSNLDWIQFHPTALSVGVTPLPLLTEALRGEGARLVDDDGVEFVDPLDNRFNVSRAILEIEISGKKAYLDLSRVDLDNFPQVLSFLEKFSIPKEKVPITPVAHYTMGGVKVDSDFRVVSVGGILADVYAAGELVYSGFHGKNRLASNSLLECFYSAWVVANSLVNGGSAKMGVEVGVGDVVVANKSRVDVEVEDYKFTAPIKSLLYDFYDLKMMQMLLLEMHTEKVLRWARDFLEKRADFWQNLIVASHLKRIGCA